LKKEYEEKEDRDEEDGGHETARKPAPEAGKRFKKHFEQGLENANPPL